MSKKQLEEMDRLKLENLRLKVLALDHQAESIQQRKQNLTTEISMLAAKMPMLKKEREEHAEKLDRLYREAKEILGLNDDEEIDLETGKVIKTNNPPTV